MVENGRKWPKWRKNVKNGHLNGQKWSIMAKNGQKLSKMTKNGQKWSKMAKKWSKMAKNWPFLTKIDEF